MISRRDALRFSAAGAAALLLGGPSLAQSPHRVQLGLLQFGTVNWEIDTIQHHGLDKANGLDLELKFFAGEQATKIAILGNAVNLIVSDWLWISRQRAEGFDLTMTPYSTSVGALMVPPSTSIKSLADLKGRKLGVAGGPLDKSWLLIQALAERDYQFDILAENEIIYGSPPLISEKLMQGELDAALNFWHFCARLEANGYQRLISAEDAAKQLGATGPISSLGYAFHDEWAAKNPDALAAFLKASREAKDILLKSDEEWLRLAPLVRAEGAELETLRDRYREGIPTRPQAEDEQDAKRIYTLLAKIGGEDLVGKSPELAAGTFWTAKTQ